MSKRKFTRESALAPVLRKDGIRLQYLDDKPFIEISEDADAGNGTWGALDYLSREHKIPAFRFIGKGAHLCT